MNDPAGGVVIITPWNAPLSACENARGGNIHV